MGEVRYKSLVYMEDQPEKNENGCKNLSSHRRTIEDGVYQYLGVPYAVAKERFTLAEEVEPWVNFAKTGVPSAEGMPAWEVYDNENGATMILDEKSTVVYGHDRELMKLLEGYSVGE